MLTTLILVVLITMFVTAAALLAPGSLSFSSAYGDEQKAMMALEAGVNYARTRLREDLTWRGGSDSGVTTTVSTLDNSMTVVEDRGNVVGLVRVGPDEVAQFRIRFNAQDGPGGVDDLDDPSPAYRLDLPFISLNNLSADSPVEKTRELAGALVGSGEILPGLQAYLAVEGRAGPAFRDASLTQPNGAPGSGRLVTRVVEAHLNADFTESLDSAAMAAGNINVVMNRDVKDGSPHIPRLDLASTWDGEKRVPPRARTKGSLNVQSLGGANLYSVDGFVDTGLGLGPDTRISGSVTEGSESRSAPFYQMKWDDIHKADPTPGSSEAVHLAAGTYVVWRKDLNYPPNDPTVDKKIEVHYYDMDLETYAEHILEHPEDPGELLDNDLNQKRSNIQQMPDGINVWDTEPDVTEDTGIEAQMVIRKDVYIEPTANTSDFSFLARRGVVSGPPDPVTGEAPGEYYPDGKLPTNSVQLQFKPGGGKQATLSGDGKITSGTRVFGEGGAITAGDNITVVGTGSLAAAEAREEDGISFYSKRNVVLNGFKASKGNTYGRYASLRVSGVIYAWGDVEAIFAPPLDAPRNWYTYFGTFIVNGAVVAYGGDPGDALSAEPGSGSGGIGPGSGKHQHFSCFREVEIQPQVCGRDGKVSLARANECGELEFAPLRILRGGAEVLGHVSSSRPQRDSHIR